MTVPAWVSQVRYGVRFGVFTGDVWVRVTVLRSLSQEF